MKKNKLFNLDEDTINKIDILSSNMGMKKSQFIEHIFNNFIQNMDLNNKLSKINIKIKEVEKNLNKLKKEKNKTEEMIEIQKEYFKNQKKYYKNILNEMATRIAMGWEIGVHKDCFYKSITFGKTPEEMYSDAFKLSKTLNYTNEEKEKIEERYNEMYS